MSRNLKRDYLKKLAGISTSNGYKIDLANYIYNPSYEHEYPTLTKVIEESNRFNLNKLIAIAEAN